MQLTGSGASSKHTEQTGGGDASSVHLANFCRFGDEDIVFSFFLFELCFVRCAKKMEPEETFIAQAALCSGDTITLYDREGEEIKASVDNDDVLPNAYKSAMCVGPAVNLMTDEEYLDLMMSNNSWASSSGLSSDDWIKVKLARYIVSMRNNSPHVFERLMMVPDELLAKVVANKSLGAIVGAINALSPYNGDVVRKHILPFRKRFFVLHMTASEAEKTVDNTIKRIVSYQGKRGKLLGNVQLTVRHARSLAAGKWLDSDVVNHYGTLLAETTPGVMYVGTQQTVTKRGSMDDVKRLLAPLVERWYRYNGSQGRERKMIRVVGIIFIHDNHYAAYCIDGPTSTITYVDSNAQAMDINIKRQLVKMGRVLFGGSGSKYKCAENPYRVQDFREDSETCPYYSLYHAWCMANAIHLLLHWAYWILPGGGSNKRARRAAVLISSSVLKYMFTSSGKSDDESSDSETDYEDDEEEDEESSS